MTEQWFEQLMDDHRVIEKVTAAVDKALQAGAEPPVEFVSKAVRFFVEFAGACHNQKEERHLFPVIESLGVPRHGGPLGIMLMEHGQSEGLLEQLRESAERYIGGELAALDTFREVFAQYSELLASHFWKENDILYPLAQRVLNAEQALQVMAGIEALEAELGQDTRAFYYGLAEEIAADVPDLAEEVDPRVMGAILSALPVEISFIDAGDRVKYFSHEDGEKIFPRLRSAVGRDVRSCHPTKSLHLVEQILADFKAGTRDSAEFWMELGGRMIYIRYFPVRDRRGQYLGTVEIVQDITDVRKLTGSKRLLD